MPTITEPEYVTFNSLVFGTPAVVFDDLGPIWTLPNIRNSDFESAGTDGETARERNFTGIRFQLRAVVFGVADEDGIVYANVRDGLRQNLAAVWTAVKPHTVSPFTRPLVHHLPDGGQRTSNAICVGIGPTVRAGAVAIKFGLDFKIPTGIWSYVAP